MPNITLFHVLAGLSGLFWTLCYIECIRRGFRDKVCCMPVEALALNATWELAFSPLFWHPEGWADRAQTYINATWFTFDVLILATFFLYGSTRGVSSKAFRAYGAAVLAATALIFGALYLLASGSPGGIKRLHELTALGVNVPMSALFLRMLWSREGPRGQSMWIAVTKMLGTGVVTIGFTLYGGFAEYPAILAAGWTCLVLDVVYTGLLWRAIRA